MPPTPWTVRVRAYNSTATDDYNNPVDAWSSPGPPQPVYGWAPAGSQEVNGWRNVVTSDVELLVPPGFSCSSRDRIELDGKLYEVVGSGVQDYNHGPFGYEPGGVVNLNYIQGSE